MTTSPNWHTAHVHYHEHDRSGLLLDALEPLLEEVSGDVNAAYVVPHWKRGPHLRIHFQTSPEVWAQRVRPAVDHIVGRHLAQHPSTTQLDEEARLPEHLRLAELEEEDGPLTPWIANNSIEYPDFVPRAKQMVGGDESEQVVTDFYVATTPPLLRHDALPQGQRPTGRSDGLSFMSATAEAFGGMSRNAGSFRSHAEGYLSDCVEPAANRFAFDRQYEQHHDTVADLMRAVVTTLDGTADVPVPLISDWAVMMRGCLERAEPALRNGIMRFTEAARQSTLDRPTTPEYQCRAIANDNYVKRSLGSHEFHRYRLVLNLTYLHLTRIGIPPQTRFLLCDLAANAIEERDGTSAIDWINTWVAEHP